MKRTRWLKWSLTACSLLATVAGWEALATADLHAGATHLRDSRDFIDCLGKGY